MSSDTPNVAPGGRSSRPSTGPAHVQTSPAQYMRPSRWRWPSTSTQHPYSSFGRLGARARWRPRPAPRCRPRTSSVPAALGAARTSATSAHALRVRLGAGCCTAVAAGVAEDRDLVARWPSRSRARRRRRPRSRSPTAMTMRRGDPRAARGRGAPVGGSGGDAARRQRPSRLGRQHGDRRRKRGVATRARPLRSATGRDPRPARRPASARAAPGPARR